MAYRLRVDRRFLRLLNVLPGDVRAAARQVTAKLTIEPRPMVAKELDGYQNYWRMWLPRNHRLIWHVLDDEELIDLIYVGPKSNDLYERLGLGRRLKDAEEAGLYTLELDRGAAEDIAGAIEQAAAGTV
jgi:mRNA-degrading endonuclease RelE of RelBE toxin-antitoxin system